MLTFRCNPAMRDALDILAKSSKINRSGVIRILLIEAMRDSLGITVKKSKKAVDTKANG